MAGSSPATTSLYINDSIIPWRAKARTAMTTGERPRALHLICPTSPAQKTKNNSVYQKRKSDVGLRHPASVRRGVSRSPRDVRRGAMDAAARETNAPARTVKPCGPVPPTLGSSFVVMIRKAMVAKSPVHQGERGAAVTPLRRECRMFRLPCYCLACAKCISFARKAHGCGQRPAFPAPSILSGTRKMQNSGISCRGNVESRPLHCHRPT
jgi:hypothetical protein